VERGTCKPFLHATGAILIIGSSTTVLSAQSRFAFSDVTKETGIRWPSGTEQVIKDVQFE